MKSSSEIRKTMDVPATIHTPLPPTPYPAFEVSIFTDIGKIFSSLSSMSYATFS